jgi:hypothetical protein
VLSAIGFVMLIAGNLLYNRIIKFQCLEPTDDEGTFLLNKEENPLVKEDPFAKEGTEGDKREGSEGLS